MNAKTNELLERRAVSKGTVIVKQGDQGYSAFLVQSGAVEVFTEDEGNEFVLAQLRTGQIFGEMSLIFDAPRSASVRALENSNLIVISRETFEKKLAGTDPTVRAVMKMLTNRIVTSNKALANRYHNFDDIDDIAQIIFHNITEKLTPKEKRVFEVNVLPHWNDFIKAMATFKEHYGEKKG